MIAVIDYGMGNIHSVQKVFQLYGAQSIVVSTPEQLAFCEKAVFPGVGAFDDAMRELKTRGLVNAIRKHINDKKPFLGICLGMQILFQESEEASREEGLGVLKGAVKRFKESRSLKVPHMGWNQIKKPQGNKCSLLNGVVNNSFVYFCHSYYPKPKDRSVVAATCEYGNNFAAVVQSGNIYGVQFHPEKSQSTGLRMLKNFVAL